MATTPVIVTLTMANSLSPTASKAVAGQLGLNLDELKKLPDEMAVNTILIKLNETYHLSDEGKKGIYEKFIKDNIKNYIEAANKYGNKTIDESSRDSLMEAMEKNFFREVKKNKVTIQESEKFN